MTTTRIRLPRTTTKPVGDLKRGDVITNTWRHLVVENVTTEDTRTTVEYRYTDDRGVLLSETWTTGPRTTVRILTEDSEDYAANLLAATVGL